MLIDGGPFNVAVIGLGNVVIRWAFENAMASDIRNDRCLWLRRPGGNSTVSEGSNPSLDAQLYPSQYRG